MIGNFILSITLIWGLLVILCVRHYYVDPYGIEEDMRALKECCRKSQIEVGILKDIKCKMEDCPAIGVNIFPIQVYSHNDNLYGLIVGDTNGKPRFFAFRRGSYSIIDYYHLRDNSKKFKKQGLKHSISIDELNSFLVEAEKEIFKKNLEEKQIYKIKKHFR